MKVSKQGLISLAMLLLAVLVSGWLVLPYAHAQAKLASSNPADGAVLNVAPPTVEVKFGEDIEPNGSSVTVKYKQDADAPQQDAGSGSVTFPDPDTMRISLKSGLGDGTYVVSWKAISETTKKESEGEYDFTVSKSAAPSSGNTAASNNSTTSTSSGSDRESGGTTIMLIILAVAVVIGIGSAVMLRQRAAVR